MPDRFINKVVSFKSKLELAGVLIQKNNKPRCNWDVTEM